jgi:hypothetical protein
VLCEIANGAWLKSVNFRQTQGVTIMLRLNVGCGWPVRYTMSTVIKVLGGLLVIVGVAFPIWGVWRSEEKNRMPNHPRQGLVLAIGCLSVFAGLALILADRITEFTVRGIGTIRAVTDQAITDAKAVSDLKARVENQSATVDLVASQAAKAKEMSELVVAQTKESAQKLETLNAAITQADDALRALKEEEDFQALILVAQNDDRASFDNLRKIAGEKDNRFSALAGQAWNTIYEAHSGPMSQSGFTLPWTTGVDPSKLSLSELSKVYQSIPSSLKPALLEYIWLRGDIQELDRLDFMMGIMKADTSLTAAEYAGRFFTQGTDQKIKAMALDYLEQWWSEHRQEFVGK